MQLSVWGKDSPYHINFSLIAVGSSQEILGGQESGVGAHGRPFSSMKVFLRAGCP